jgi:hypothetical protein
VAKVESVAKMIQITRTSNCGFASGEVPITFKRVEDRLGTFFGSSLKK